MAEKMTYADKPWVKSCFVEPFKLPKTLEPYPKMSVYNFLENSARAVLKFVEFKKDLALTLAIKVFRRKFKEREMAKMKERREMAG